MRGRLIFPFLAEVFRLNTLGTSQATPDADVHTPAGYDPDFMEPTLKDGGDMIGDVARVELSPVLIRCQVKMLSFEELRQTGLGDVPRGVLELTLFAKDFEDAGLLDVTTGLPSLQKNDRVARILTRDGSKVALALPVDGYFVTMVRPTSFGFSPNPQRNLFKVTCEAKEEGIVR